MSTNITALGKGGSDLTISEPSRKRISRLEREINRLRISPALRLGEHITTAMRRPWRAPFLPISLPFLMLKIGFEMLGRRKSSANNLMPQYDLSQSRKNTIVMFPTNGVGFGHFTRLLAIAKRMKKLDRSLEVIFFTTMPTLHILKEYGIPAHHVSGANYFRHLDSTKWNALIEEEIILCLETHKPSMFIFDGAFPYRGMLRGISAFTGLEKVWMRRGTFKKGTNIPIDSISHFDLIIHPKDSVKQQLDELIHKVNSISSPPIVLLDSNELLSRQSARRRLGLQLDSIAVYVQLGAGEINDIQSDINVTIKTLMNYQNVEIVLGESMLGRRQDIDFDGVHLLRDYPNTMYYNAFDATIQAGGYNSYHEVRSLNIPTLFYPNLNTGMDDQLARCNVAEQEGWGIVLQNRNPESISKAIRHLLDNLAAMQTSKRIEDHSMELPNELISRIAEMNANNTEEE